MNRALLLIARWIGRAFALWLSTLRRPLAAEAISLRTLNDKLRAENELLRARLLRLDAHRRPHYKPSDRLSILWHQARWGLSNDATARAFVLCATTLSNWMAEVENGMVRLVRARQPLNKLPDLVREIVWRLKDAERSWGTRRIAGVLAKLAIKGSRASVQRIVRQPPPRKTIAARAPRRKIRRCGLRPKRPRHMFFTDFTKVRCLGMFTLTIGAVVDGFSRKLLAIAAWRSEPTAEDARLLLAGAIRAAGGKPRHLVTDRGAQFTAKRFVRYLRRRGIRHRYGAVGEHGSIARMERVWLSLKREFIGFFFALVPLEWASRRLCAWARWYNEERPHMGLGLRTPSEVFAGRSPRRTRRLRPDDRFVLSVEHIGGPRELPKYALRRVA